MKEVMRTREEDSGHDLQSQIPISLFIPNPGIIGSGIRMEAGQEIIDAEVGEQGREKADNGDGR